MASLPDKLYFKIGEASRIVGVKPYVLRYWETEFNVRPGKTKSKHRIYRKRDVELLLEIKRLLYDERYTIEGARKRLKELQKENKDQLDLPLEERAYRALLIKIRKDLQSLYKSLTGGTASVLFLVALSI
jgi:DNA-binding transcriptional MerR regulator